MVIQQCDAGIVNNLMVQVGLSFSDGKHKHAVFQCHCGKRKILRVDHVKTGRTKNCGCRYGASTHQQSRSRVYRIWQGMNQRCGNSKAANFARYGGRGIVVCDEWKMSFECFWLDMGDPPDHDMQLDRIDNNGGYCKANCRWVTRAVNQQNRRNSKRNKK